MRTVKLRTPALDDESWEFQVAQDVLSFTSTPTKLNGILISFSGEAITLKIDKFPSNRILNSDDLSKFIHMSFDRTFRFPEQPPRVTVEYIMRMMKKGFFLNGVQYRFYHHSNSQLVSLSTYYSTHCAKFLLREDDLAFSVKPTQTQSWTIESIDMETFKRS